MQQTHPTARLPVDLYAIELRDHLVRILCARHGNRAMAEDVAGAETLRFLERPERTLEKYPSPLAYASARATHGRSDHLRRERVQRCEGSRLIRNSDGTYATGNKVLTADALIDGDDSMWERIADERSLHDDALAERLDNADAARRALANLPADQQTLVVNVVSIGHTVTESARHADMARETAQRKLRRALDTMRDELAA